jgi:acid phosphatase
MVAVRAICASAAVLLALLLPSVAAADSQTFTATADAYVTSDAPSANYGSDSRLWVQTGPPLEQSYLRFDVELPAGAIITGATLQLYAGAGSTSSGYQAYAVSDITWDESTITYANAPAFGARLGTSGGWSFGDAYMPITLPDGYIHTGLNSIGVGRSATSTVDFWSREAGANPPQLVVTYTLASTSTSTSTTTTTTTPTTTTTTPTSTSTTPTSTSSTTSSTSTSTSTSTSGSGGGVGVYGLRGVYDRDLSSSGFSDEAQVGFDLIDSTPSNVDDLTGGLRGLVWVGAYDNSTCSWQVSDSELANDVAQHFGDSRVAAWFIADEPDPLACPGAPAQVKARTALIHSVDPGAKVLVVLDSNSGYQSLDQMAGWVGTADVFGLDPYTCWQGQSSCVFSWIDQVAAKADQVGLPYWGIVQGFGEGSGGSWFEGLDSSGNPVSGQARLPTADELHQEFVHWRATQMQDYLVFAWRWPHDSSQSSLWLANQPALLSQLTSENATSAAGSSGGGSSTTTTSTTPTTTTTPTSSSTSTTTTTTPPPPDTTPPSAPSGLAVTGTTPTSISLGWNPSTDDVGVTGYGIYVNGSSVGSTPATSYIFGGLLCATTYQLGVDAYDAAGNRSTQTTMLATTSPCPSSSGTPHIMIIAEENHSYDTIIGNSNLPYMNSLATKYGLATNWWGLSHPSEPNYLGMVSGSISDNPSDLTPQDETYPGPTVVDQMASAGIGWKAYMEDMPQACDLTDTYSPGDYDVNHDPFMYFTSIRNNAAQCNQVVPFTEFGGDLADNTAPPFMFVTPNLIHDMHDGTDADADTWLQNTMSEVFASQWYAQGGIVIITWDEGETSDQIATIVVAANDAGQRLGTYGNHYGMLRAIEEAYGLPLLGHAADSTVGDLTPLF